MSNDFVEAGRNNPDMQLVMMALEANFRATVNNLSKPYDLQAAVAMVAVALGAVALGAVVGDVQARVTEHAKECENCAKLAGLSYYELCIKNFGAGFGEAKRHTEQEFAAGAVQADDLLAKILKEHGK